MRHLANNKNPCQGIGGAFGTSQCEESASQANLAQALKLFASLEQVHLVAIHSGTEDIETKWFGTDLEGALRWATERNAQGHNIYWTVNLVPDCFNRKPKKEDILAARFVHVDIDRPKHGGPFDKEAVATRLENFPTPPGVVIDSGNGLQAFWRLDAPCVDMALIETINRQAALAFGGDSCHNIDRPMRVPGFVNWPDATKKARGCKPVLARWLREDGHVYAPSKLVAAFPKVAEPKKRSIDAGALIGDFVLQTSDSLGLEPLHPARAAIDKPDLPDRSAAGVKAAGLLAEHGLTDAQIMGVLLNPANAVSAHYLDQKDPKRAAARAIEHVRKGPRQGEGGGGVCLTDFYAHMPSHGYIFAPSGEFWPATSVNSRVAPVTLTDAAGKPRFDDKGKPAKLKANLWLDQNRAVEQMTWAPGQPQIIADRLVSDGGWIDREGCNVFNLYRPPAELAGDAALAGPWLEHVRRVYPDDAEHIIRWLAHRVQHSQEKINHALVMGGAQGIGKDTILEPVKAAVGPWNFAEVSPQHLLGRFNGYVKSVILRVSEARDLGDIDRFAFYDHMKTYTAAPPDVLRVDEKHLREYSVFNVCGVIITSNHRTDGIFLPADDRRHFVAWSGLAKDAFPSDYWRALYSWYGNGGTGHVAAYLRDLSLGDFDPKAPPPKTAAFWDIVQAGQAPEDAEMADALDRLGRPRAVTIRQIADAAACEFGQWLLERRNSRRIPHRLEACGYVGVRNASAKDGYYTVFGKRCAVYAKRELSTGDAIAAAEWLAGSLDL